MKESVTGVVASGFNNHCPQQEIFDYQDLPMLNDGNSQIMLHTPKLTFQDAF